MEARFGGAIAGRAAAEVHGLIVRSASFFAWSAALQFEAPLVIGPLPELSIQEQLEEPLDRKRDSIQESSHTDHVGRGQSCVRIEDLSVVDILSLGKLVRVVELAHEDDVEHDLEDGHSQESCNTVLGGLLT